MLRKTLLFLLFPLLGCTGGRTNDSDAGSSDAQEKKEASASGQENNGIIHCFAYHRFGNDRYPSTNISLDRFRAHLEFLQKHDYEVLTLGKALKRMRKEKLSGKTAVLTMDDGYSSVNSGAVPLLEEYGYKASIFVCTEYVGGKNNLSWEKLKELQKKGYEIGNHSHSHAHFLNARSDSIGLRFKKDLERSEKLFKKKLGETPDLYAYPYGEYHPEMERILEKRGYRGAVAQYSGVISGDSKKYALPRFPMTSFYGKAEKFREKAKMYPLPVTREEPETPLMNGKNPPLLELTLREGEIDTGRIQCFVDGKKNAELNLKSKADGIQLKMRSKEPLKDRRTLYTITAPNADGDWHWYSKLWVDPEKGE